MGIIIDFGRLALTGEEAAEFTCSFSERSLDILRKESLASRAREMERIRPQNETAAAIWRREAHARAEERWYRETRRVPSVPGDPGPRLDYHSSLIDQIEAEHRATCIRIEIEYEERRDAALEPVECDPPREWHTGVHPMPEAEVAVDTVTVDDGMGVWSHSPGMPPAFLGEVDGTLLRPVAGYITLDEYTMFDPVPMYPPGGEDELPRNSEARLLALNALALRTAIVHADSEDVRDTVARLAPTDVLADMTGDRCEAIRRIVASRLPIGSPELAGMADDTAPWVRKQAAHRVPVGSPAWSKLAQDENEVVRDVANHRR